VNKIEDTETDDRRNYLVGFSLALEHLKGTSVPEMSYRPFQVISEG